MGVLAMTVWVVVWVVLMLFWLFAGWQNSQPTPPVWSAGASTVIPWLCVLILGLVLFGALSPGSGMR